MPKYCLPSYTLYVPADVVDGNINLPSLSVVSVASIVLFESFTVTVTFGRGLLFSSLIVIVTDGQAFACCTSALQSSPYFTVISAFSKTILSAPFFTSTVYNPACTAFSEPPVSGRFTVNCPFASVEP